MTQSDHISITCNGHCACAISRDLSPGEGAKIVQNFFKSPVKNYTTT